MASFACAVGGSFLQRGQFPPQAHTDLRCSTGADEVGCGSDFELTAPWESTVLGGLRDDSQKNALICSFPWATRSCCATYFAKSIDRSRTERRNQEGSAAVRYFSLLISMFGEVMGGSRNLSGISRASVTKCACKVPFSLLGVARCWAWRIPKFPPIRQKSTTISARFTRSTTCRPAGIRPLLELIYNSLHSSLSCRVGEEIRCWIKDGVVVSPV